MNILIFGGTGFIGNTLSNHLLDSGHMVFVVSRNNRSAISNDNLKTIKWENNIPISFADTLPPIDAVINLSGESIGNKRWSRKIKSKIFNSRIKTTRSIVNSINNGGLKTKILINASAVGYYGDRHDKNITEQEPAGTDFLAEVCKAWENEAHKIINNSVRVLTLRFGIVLGNGGALKKMILPLKYFVGGAAGSGKQWISWIHIDDLTELIVFIIRNTKITGAVNASAPEPVTNRDFCKMLGNIINRPCIFKIPDIILKIVLGEMSQILLHGQYAVPDKIINAGFVFKYPTLKPALENIFYKL